MSSSRVCFLSDESPLKVGHVHVPAVARRRIGAENWHRESFNVINTSNIFLLSYFESIITDLPDLKAFSSYDKQTQISVKKTQNEPLMVLI